MFWKSKETKLREYQFPVGFEFRLQSETGWDKDRIRNEISNYKKFMVVASKQPATPSKSVDIVWHMHILYTRDYEKFCKDIFGKYIHHDPSDGKEESKKKYESQYRKTEEQISIDSGNSCSSNSSWSFTEWLFGDPGNSDSFGGGSFGGGGADSGDSCSSCSSSCGSSCGGGD